MIHNLYRRAIKVKKPIRSFCFFIIFSRSLFETHNLAFTLSPKEKKDEKSFGNPFMLVCTSVTMARPMTFWEAMGLMESNC